MDTNPYLDDVGLDRFKQNIDADLTAMTAEFRAALADKVDKIVGKVLSSNDYTDEEKATVADLKTKMATLLSDAKTPGSIEYISLNAMLAIIDGAPEDFNTLKEMSDWIATHEDSAAAMNTNIQDNARAITALQTGKVDKETGKGLSTNDFTDADKSKLGGVATGANNYTLPAATNTVRGGVKTGYAANGKNYPVQLSNEQMFVNVPWTDTNTTYEAATAVNAGLMSAADKVKLNELSTDAKTLNGLTAQQIWGYTDAFSTPPEQTTAYLQNCNHNNHIKNVLSLFGYLESESPVAESVISFGNGGFVFQIMYSPNSKEIAYRSFWNGALLDDNEGWTRLGNTATPTSAGLMSGEDKAKLDSLEARIAALEAKQ